MTFNKDAEEAVQLNNKAGDNNGGTAKWANQRLEEMLGFGKYQWFQVWIFLGLTSFLGAMDMFHMIFMVTKKLHRCTLPGNLEGR